MPLYEFQCLDCEKVYQELTKWDETEEYPNTFCPQCNSNKKEKLISVSNFQFSNPTNTSKFDSFSYRAGFNMDKAKAERRHAEEFSHVGDAPYRSIDDITSGENFGEIK